MSTSALCTSSITYVDVVPRFEHSRCLLPEEVSAVKQMRKHRRSTAGRCFIITILITPPDCCVAPCDLRAAVVTNRTIRCTHSSIFHTLVILQVLINENWPCSLCWCWVETSLTMKPLSPPRGSIPRGSVCTRIYTKAPAQPPETTSAKTSDLRHDTRIPRVFIHEKKKEINRQTHGKPKNTRRIITWNKKREERMEQ